MGVCKSPPVELQPMVFLSSWQVMEADQGFRYFIGHKIETMSGRASTCIVKFDLQTRRGVAGSGTIYELVGESGVDAEANYLWAVTCAKAGTSSTDISSDYDQPAIASHRPVVPFVAHLFYENGLGHLSAKIPATGQSFEVRDPEDLADLLFAKGVRQGYMRLSHFEKTENRPEFVDLVRAVEHRLKQLERGSPRDTDGAQSTE